MRVIAMICFVAFGAGTASAQTFDPHQTEVELSYESTKNGGTRTVMGLRGEWYLQKLQGKYEPLAERAFLGHVSFVGAELSRHDIKNGLEGDGFSFGVGGRFVGNKEEMPLTLGVEFTIGSLDFGNADLDLQVWEVVRPLFR